MYSALAAARLRLSTRQVLDQAVGHGVLSTIQNQWPRGPTVAPSPEAGRGITCKTAGKRRKDPLSQ